MIEILVHFFGWCVLVSVSLILLACLVTGGIIAAAIIVEWWENRRNTKDYLTQHGGEEHVITSV